MATRAVATRKLATGAFEWKWTGLLNGDDGGPLNPDLGGVTFADKSVHVKGDFSGGAAVVIEGSNDGVTWVVLTNPQGGPLDTILVESIVGILENAAYIRPRVRTGDGSTNITVIIVGRAIIQLR